MTFMQIVEIIITSVSGKFKGKYGTVRGIFLIKNPRLNSLLISSIMQGMDLLSFDFLLFLPVLTIVYFIVPKRCQWWALLAGSLFFYACSGPNNLIYIAITSLSAYLAARRMDQISAAGKEEWNRRRSELDRAGKKSLKERYQRRKRLLLAAVMILNFGLLSYFKYLHFVIAQISRLVTAFGGAPLYNSWKIIAPLGISFYTFQTMGYVADVYWEKVPAESHPLRMLLFTSFFPQVTQGPISEWRQLSGELFAEHRFTYHNFSWGMQRMLWGFFKKVALANALSAYFLHLTKHYTHYTGISALCGAFLYSIQIYADFSGYMDIVCGYCEILGIRLMENFNRPYFSKSVAEYWRRWHISLGNWFKNYIYYPIAMTKWNQDLGRRAKKLFGRHFGSTVPATIALVVTWLATGLWHGATWGYIIWGGLNGMFIIFSLWMEPVYESWKKKLGIRDTSTPWRIFQVIRTFTLLTLIKILPEVGGLRKGLGLWKQILTNHTIPTSLAVLFPRYARKPFDFWIICIGSLLLLTCDLIQRKQPVRQWFEEHVPYPARIFFFAFLAVLTVYVGGPYLKSAGGFMYADF